MSGSVSAVLGHEPTVDSRLTSAVSELERQWPRDLATAFRLDRERLVEHVALVQRSGPRLLDIGGGYSPFPAVCAALGMEVAVADNYAHEFFDRPDLPALLGGLGVTCRTVDVVREPMPFGDQSFDVVTSFDSLEHWHHSPRALFAEIRRVLRPGGLFLLGVPNAVNLRKRLTVLLGRSNWSRFDDWYGPADFHGHVREPTLGDLERMVPDLGLDRWTTFGRNWQGYYRSSPVRALVVLLDMPLRLRPTLCSDLYLIGRRDGSTSR